MTHRILTAAAAIALALPQAAQQPIRSGVELVRIDVQVTTRDGQPALNLRPDQFEVNIDGKVRPVVTIDLVKYNTTASASVATPGSSGSPAASAPATAAPADPRVLILAIDETSFMTTTRQAPVELVTRLAAMADARDLIGLISFPAPGIVFSPSTDRAGLLEAAKKIDGRLQLPRNSRISMSLAEAVDWATDPEYRARILTRECGSPAACPAAPCGCDVEMQAQEIVGTFQMQASMSVAGLKSVLGMVKAYPGRKTLIVASAGFVATDRMGAIGRATSRPPDITFEADMMGKRAAEANAVLYSLHMDVSFLYAFSAASGGRELQTVFRNSQMLARGLEQFTGSAGGSTIAVHAGPDPALKRLLSETSAYYLLGVEPVPEHRDGNLHRITVKVKQGGTQVRSRASVLIPKAGAQ